LDWIKDKSLPGLYRRPRKDGRDVWAVKARVKGGKPVSITLGKANYITAAEARKLAKPVLAKLSQGINPNQEQVKAKKVAEARGFTLGQAIEEYSELAHWKPKTRKDALSTLHRRFGDWYRKPLASISREDVLKRFTAIKKEVAQKKEDIANRRRKQGLSVYVTPNEVGLGEAQRAFRYLSAVFNSFASDDAAGEKLMPQGNPVLVLKDKKLRRALQPKERYLDNKVRQGLLERLTQSLHYQYAGSINQEDADLAWLLIHTGLRIDEARLLKWSEVSLTDRFFTVLDTKNHQKHTLPMTNSIYSMLSRKFEYRARQAKSMQSPYIFPSPLDPKKPTSASRTFDRLSSEIGFEFTAHDLRRTVATVAADLGYDLDAIGAVLNHKKKGVTAGYIQKTWKRHLGILEDIQNGLFEEPYD
jgi:integrase